MKITFVTGLKGFGQHLVGRVEGSALVPPSRPRLEGELGVSLLPTGMPAAEAMVNYTDLAASFMREPERRTKILRGLNCTQAPVMTQLYALWDGSGWSEWMEFNFSGRFMAGDVGPELGFVCGAAHRAGEEPGEGLSNLDAVEAFLEDLEYRGEVWLAVGEDFAVADIRLGHMTGMLCMYAEMAQIAVGDLFTWAAGASSVRPTLYDSAVVANMVSLSPFPASGDGRQIKAPASAEKHLWRLNLAGAEPTIVTCHGANVTVARNRVFQTIGNMAKWHPDLQYRVDVAQKGKFFFNLLGQQQSPSGARTHSEVPGEGSPTETAAEVPATT